MLEEDLEDDKRCHLIIKVVHREPSSVQIFVSLCPDAIDTYNTTNGVKAFPNCGHVGTELVTENSG